MTCCKSVRQMLECSSVCFYVRSTRGAFAVLACGESHDTPTPPPSHPDHLWLLSPGIHLWVSASLSCPGCHGYSLKRHPGRRTEMGASFWLQWLLEFAMNYNPEAPGAEAGWQQQKYGCGFVCCDIWRQQRWPCYAALVALYFSAQKLLCLFM